jgi:hypothetical protein
MRERITFLQKLGDSLEPSAVSVDGAALTAPDVYAAREDRLTLSADDLPADLQTLLEYARDLRIRWVSTAAFDAVSPLVARLPPGFHLFFSPGGADSTASYALS